VPGDAGPPIRTAVIGYGLAGRVFHAPLVAAADGLELVAVVTGDPVRQEQLRADHPGAAVIASADELLGRADSYDLVVVAAPNDAHVPLGLAAVERGKAVVVDKPLALSADQGAHLVSAAEAAGVSLTVFQNRRWDSDQLTLRRLIADRSLGDVLRYESRFERWRPQPRAGSWRESLPADRGGGLLLDLGSHIVDQALHLFGPAKRVYAEVDARRGVSDDDVFIALEHVSGVRSHLWAGALAGSPGPRLRVLGTGGAFVVDALDGQEQVLLSTGRLPAGGLPEPESAWGRLVRGEESSPVPSEPGRWDLFYPAVAAAVRGQAPVPVDPRDAVSALRVLEAARRSAGTGQVVELSQ
jgi:predicted dehydrogenase